MYSRNRAVPMKRAKFSANRPKVSASTCGRRTSWRRTSRGWSSRGPRPSRRGSRGRSARATGAASAAHPTGGAAGGVAPVLGQQVVEEVVDGDRTNQVAVLVDDRTGHEVVRREVAG